MTNSIVNTFVLHFFVMWCNMMLKKKKTVSSRTDTVDFQDHYILGNFKIYNSVTVTFMRFLNNQAVDQMVDGLPAWPHLPGLPISWGLDNAKLFQLPLLKV
jgi:hypothetical protein